MATAKIISRPTAKLYDEDYYDWTKAQAAALRRLAAEDWSGPLDLQNLAEEMDDLGKAELRLVRNQLIRLMRHCLKLRLSPADRPRGGWQNTVDEARDALAGALTASLRRVVDPEVPALYAKARIRAARDLESYGEAVSLPETCPYTLDELLEDDWYPAQSES